ncbi:enoyl-CoA hydratase/isomerase family protein [Comamonas thiooxydans]|uniref:enoyl-CoA hydratase/isomerase family protein n=1 Tax=Comamonas thiooxydans TaxID=363952 RepID=UPI000B189C3E|nr:enoyl-CoA hydratase/isomerase family protein [Comamonas thiooxydans]
MEQKAIEFQIENGIARITLNRPKHGNAVNADLADELLTAVQASITTSDVSVLLIEASGNNFCYGGDIVEFSRAGCNLDKCIERIITPFHAALALLSEAPFPVITAIQGHAAGGGLSLALAGDFALAADTAFFRTAYIGLGFAGDGGITHILARLVGTKKSIQLMLSNEKISAESALTMGLIDEITSPDLLQKTALNLARNLSTNNIQSMKIIKSLVNRFPRDDFKTQLNQEQKYMISQAREVHTQAAIQKFLGK